jgi:hypothetical protein
MVIKRVSPMSAAKVGGILGVLLGLVIGACISLAMLAAGSAMSTMTSTSGDEQLGRATGMMSMFFGVGAIIILPIFYGVVSFVGGALYAALYNLAAKWVGGIEIEAA